MAYRWCAAALMLAASAGAQGAVDWLPDMIVDPVFLEDHEVRSDIRPGRFHLIFSNAMANVGDGPLYMFAVKPKGKHAGDEQTQKVKQRIFRSDGTHYNRLAGVFVFHPAHNHTHVDDWAIYRLREVLPGGGVGATLGTSRKTSFCLLDSYKYDTTLPNAPDDPQFSECNNQVQGISVGYEDLYDKSIPGQWIDVTDLPEGEYWLESEVDPKNNVLEKDETNNVARIKVTIEKTVTPPDPEPEPNPSGLLAAIIEFIRQLIEALRSGGG